MPVLSSDVFTSFVAGQLVRRLSLEDYSRLVDALYRSSLDTGAWETFLSMFSSLMGGVWTCVQAHDYRANVNIGFIAGHWDPVFVGSYRSEYARINPWNAATLRSNVGEARTSESLVDPRALRKSRFYNEWIKPQEDIGTGAGITVHRDQKAFMRFSCNIRSRDQEKLQTDLVRVLNLLAPHLQRAFSIARRLGGQRFTAELDLFLESVGGAVLLLDAQGRQNRANRDAEALRTSGVYDLDSKGRIVIHDRAADAALARAVKAIMSHDYKQLPNAISVRGPDGRLLTATIAPLQQGDEVAANLFDAFREERPIAILCLADRADRGGPTPQDLQRLFDLTPAEAALALTLYEGGTLKTFAEGKDIRVDTARKQLSSVFDKTGTSQQSQLVAQIARIIGRSSRTGMTNGFG